ncbi:MULTISPECIES: GMC family oxidoreductase [unclassified Sphingopyxis]|uniref:GMC family oxidoreductase N-terminal domain-containing protein n=1 Tax=unclassified Sphingopyxis TaxID=2614943 RepID=UPI000736607A|nr:MULTISPECIES: GMC family oxidoreductase [unclassified Sphingopyxis]KTE23942.1 glucose-methanol-choline oxidoreductase [Sphingopyxis sp. H057]KTE51095.1 glucose-methanol-choline oxidoreductase [Sphingopyxis sp. H073]KTE51308.1 glucose-methanol-choline oxidoreductase [Sphingopyxis sp. H071]KTE58787.1 glucose-methanol-choline oxidoreductase [Sphingopyxis sp. H107]KTE63345.1 glucose-methanol-choline oxidoreductase [Sphingopyxis sp. H100]
MAAPFNFGQLKFLKALTEALFHGAEMKITPDQVVANISSLFGKVGGTKLDEIRLSLTGTEIVLGPMFAEVGVATRVERIRNRLQNSQIDLFQDMARLRGIVYACYYGHWMPGDQDANLNNPVHKQIGFTLPKHRVRGPGELEIKRVEGREIDDAFILDAATLGDEYDVIVVGSGAGGSVAAYNVAARGYKVLIVEAGPFYPSPRIDHHELDMVANLFKHGALQTSTDRDFVVFQGRCVGGSSTVNNGICLRVNEPGRTHPDAVDVLDKWASIGAPVDKAAFHASYDAIRGRLGIDTAEPRSGRHNGPHLTNGWHAYAATSSDPREKRAVADWFAKNFGPPNTPNACAYCGYCNAGCPYGRRMGMAQTYLPDACRDHGARILPGTKAERIVWQTSIDGRREAEAVKLVLPGGSERFVRARVGVVVAAGTIASSKFLDRSDISGTGYQVSLNIASPVVALMPPGVGGNAWDEDQMTSYVDCGDFLLESHFQPPMAMASLMPGWFGDHAARMKNFGRVHSAGILFPADRRGQVTDGKLKFKLDVDEDLPLLRRAMATLTKVHFAAGALECYPALTKGQVVTPDMDIDDFFEEAIKEADDATLSSSHPHGGNAINEDPQYGVVDPECRVHGTTNVLVTDASVFPTCIRVNAQWTTMAMAHYATARSDPFR